jgi:acetolactate synthase regulatory subunit
MISGRGFNIDSLNVAPTHDASLSRITIVLNGDEAALDLCIKQLRKLVNVVECADFKEGQAVARELVLVKVRADSKSRPEIMQITDIFRAKIINMSVPHHRGDRRRGQGRRLPRPAGALRHPRARPHRPPRPQALSRPRLLDRTLHPP